MTIPELPFDPSLLPEREGVYLVGGTTRDVLLGLTPVDYDIAVSRNPEKFARLTAARNNGRLVRMGRPGKTSYRVLAGRMIMDITGLSGPTIGHDLENRDVTINAMAIDLASGKLVDRLGGRRDLAEKRIRMVSDKSFGRDPIRLLRVFRFAAVLGFSIEAQTISTVSRDADLIRLSAGERIRSELHTFFSCRQSFPFLLEMADTGLLTSIFPELTLFRHSGSREDGESRLFEHVLSTYKHLENLLCDLPPGFPSGEEEDPSPANPDQSAWLKCAALLHPVGEPCDPAGPTSGNPRPDDRKKTESALAVNACRRLRLSLKEQRLVSDIVLHHRTPRHLYENYCKKTLGSRAIIRFFMTLNVHAPHLLLHALADAGSEPHRQFTYTKAFSDFIQRLLRTYYETYLPRKALPPLVTGRDLITVFGLSPSAVFKRILTRLEEERLSGDLTNREAALRMAGKMIPEF